MKNTISFIALLFFSISLISCENEETKTSNEKIIDEITVDLTASKLGDNVSLMTYSSLQELEDKIPELVSSILDDIEDEKNQDSRTSDAFINLKFVDGKVFLSEIVFYDKINDLFISGLVLDFDTMLYQTINRIPPHLLVGGCPSGYTSLGTCSNFSNPKACVSNIISTFMSANISGLGDCAAVQISVGSLAATVCGKIC